MLGTSMNEADELALLVADVYELAGALRASGDRLARRAGQTQARWQVLSVVSEGAWTVPTIASRLGVTRQAVQRIADDLAEEGSLRYIENPAHRRSPLLEPTTVGRAALAAIGASSLLWRSQVAESVTQQEVKATREVLRRILNAIRTTPVEGSA